jgi:hypothetical protein
MNDTLTIKKLTSSGLTAEDFDAGNSFARVHSGKTGTYLRKYTNSPASGDIVSETLRIAHQSRDGSSAVQRTVVANDYEITRRQAGVGGTFTVPTGILDKGKAAFQFDLPRSVSYAEFEAYTLRIIGFLTENNCANLQALYNGEY